MNKEESLIKELKILKEALDLTRANDKLGVLKKFAELCAHQQEVIEQEAHDVTTQVIRNAQRYARGEVQSRYDEGDQGKPHQEDHQGKEQ